MHYVDEGGGDPVLLLHGEPTWGVPVPEGSIPKLRGGTSSSSCPTTSASVARTSRSIPAGTRTTRTIGSVERLVCEALDLSGLTVVVHDWGGPIGLRLAVEHEERVERLVRHEHRRRGRRAERGVAPVPGDGAPRRHRDRREPARPRLLRDASSSGRGGRGLRRAVPRAASREARGRGVPGARPDRAATIRARPRCSTVRDAARALGEAGARPRGRLRPDLLASTRRADGRADSRAPGRPRPSRAPATCSRRTRARRSPRASPPGSRPGRRGYNPARTVPR